MMPAHSSGAHCSRGRFVGHAQNIVLVSDDAVGITSIGRRALLIASVVGPDRLHAAVLLHPRLALGTRAARIYVTAHANFIAHLVFRNLATYRVHNSGDLMPGYHGEDHFLLILAPLIARLVNVRVANAAVFDLDHHIMLPRFATLKAIGPQRSFRFCSGISLTRAHDFFPFE